MAVAMKSHTMYELARLAGCSDPDSPTSPGAQFLAMVEATLADYDDPDYDTAWEIADNAPSVYTHEMWMQFVDLAAYSEDPSEVGADGADMEKSARVCLFMIAERLCIALIEEMQE